MTFYAIENWIHNDKSILNVNIDYLCNYIT